MLIALKSRRIDEACVPCRSLKKKCNGQKPCDRCKNRKKSASCIYKSEYAKCESTKMSFQPYRITKTQEGNRRRRYTLLLLCLAYFTLK